MLIDRIRIGGVSLEYDRDYGIGRRSGWSVAVAGSYRVQFERWLVVALWKAWRSGSSS